MTTGAHIGDPLSTKSHPPATPNPEAATGFGTYAEYLAKLERSTVVSHAYRNADQLWLASFDEDGHCMGWNYCNPFKQNSLDVPRCLPAPDGSGVRPHITVLPSHGFRTVLQTPDEDVAYRVVIVAAGSNAIVPQTKGVLGFGLDLGPEIFEYAQICLNRHAALPRPWHKVSPALRIGQNALCILEARPGRPSKTAILFLGNNHPLQSWGLTPRVSTSSVMYPPPRPSQVSDALSYAADQPDDYYQTTWLVQRFITSGIGSNNSFGKGNFLYVCLAALVELHLSTVPLNVPHIGMHDLESEVRLEHLGEYGQKRTLNPFSADPSMIWAELRKDVDKQRTTLRWITRFFRQHFDYSNRYVQAAFDDTVECFKFRVEDLEQYEAQLRDHLSLQGTSKSIRMAKMSIRESKRVMLLTALAFIFLPVSLAASVYGMNVQQINSTGHSISAFVITALAMCASSVTLWATLAAFQSYRARLISEQELKRNATHPWYKEIIIHGPLGRKHRLLYKIRWLLYGRYWSRFD